MRFVVLGAGMQGTAIAYDLARADGVEEVVVADRSEAQVESALARARAGAGGAGVPVPCARLLGQVIDIRNVAALDELVAGANGVVGAVSYDFNYDLARSAILARANFCDLGGNNDMVARELSLDDAAKAAGVCVIPDCGLAPGLASMLVAEGLRRLGRCESVRIRVGGLPQRPRPPLDYQVTFAVRGLINEYVEPAQILESGRIVTALPFSAVETISFTAPHDLRAPIGSLEAFITSGGSSTLPESFGDRVRNLDYKTIRYPGHCARMKTMMDLGLFDSRPIEVRGAGDGAHGDGVVRVAPRDVIETVLARALPANEPDVVLVRVAFYTAAASEAAGHAALTFEMIDRFDAATGFTAMMRTTGFPAAVAIWLAARGEVTARGAHTQERCLDAERFVMETRRRGLEIRET